MKPRGQTQGLALLLVVISAACSSAPEPDRPEPIVVETVRRDCLPEPAPEPRPIEIAGPADGCPDAWAACLDRDALAALVRYLAAMQRWAKAVEISCGTEGPAEGET